MGIEVVIAAIVAYIAWQQHKTNRDKLRLNLYNKRYEVFYSLMVLLSRISQQLNIKLEQIDEFSRATKEAVFLFDEGIETYLETIRKKALDLWATKTELEGLPKGDARSAKARAITKLSGWFRKQHDVAIDKFGKYLKFKNQLKGKAMNWKRGFRRIAFVLALAVAIACVGLSVTFVLDVHDDAQFYLQWKKDNYLQSYSTALDELLTESDPTTINVPEGFVLEKTEPDFQAYKQEKQEAEAEIKKMESGFWVNLSKSGLIGLCVAGGLAGAIIGFVVVWFIYRLLEWLTLGFATTQ